MQLFAGDLQIIFHTSSSVVFRRTFRVETGGDCAISRLMSEQSGRLSLTVSIFSLKKHENLFASSSAELCSGSFDTFCLKRSSFMAPLNYKHFSCFYQLSQHTGNMRLITVLIPCFRHLDLVSIIL